ncbi:hypothetical protein Emed_007037 [Eimeria media]
MEGKAVAGATQRSSVTLQSPLQQPAPARVAPSGRPSSPVSRRRRRPQGAKGTVVKFVARKSRASDLEDIKKRKEGLANPQSRQAPRHEQIMYLHRRLEPYKGASYADMRSRSSGRGTLSRPGLDARVRAAGRECGNADCGFALGKRHLGSSPVVYAHLDERPHSVFTLLHRTTVDENARIDGMKADHKVCPRNPTGPERGSAALGSHEHVAVRFPSILRVPKSRYSFLKSPTLTSGGVSAARRARTNGGPLFVMQPDAGPDYGGAPKLFSHLLKDLQWFERATITGAAARFVQAGVAQDPVFLFGRVNQKDVERLGRSPVQDGPVQPPVGF